MKKQQGFSLVELMIVVVIIGALTAIAVPTYQDYVKKADIAAEMATLSSSKVIVETFMAENSYTFPDEALSEFPQGVSLSDGTDGIKMTKVTMTYSDGAWSCVHNVDGISMKGCAGPEGDDESNQEE